jgi:hypothetical protein
MFLTSTCACLVCQVEMQLHAELNADGDATQAFLLARSDRLRQFPSISVLLSVLRLSEADPRSDELFRELFAARQTNRQVVERLLLLAFLPTLHHTVRRVTKHQPTLSPDDVAQHALSVFLQFLDSEHLRTRISHFAFAISRAVKRRMFEWAKREGALGSAQIEGGEEVLAAVTISESFEQYALLHHFLDRCLAKGLLTNGELDLLIQINLEGNSSGEFQTDHAARGSRNAVRQRTKRLLAKLRRLAG